MDAIAEAFKSVPRVDFVPEWLKDHVNVDTALPIGAGQTISQPSTVRMMLEWLGAQPRDKVLDVGSGSGWTSALLSNIIGSKGKVFAVERIPKLLEQGRENCKKVGALNVQFFQAGKSFGLPLHAPYDRILVSAAAQKLPIELLDQLKVGGKLVIPIGHEILEISKISDKDYETKSHPGFIFVPLSLACR